MTAVMDAAAPPRQTGPMASPAASRVSPRWEDPRTVAGFVTSPPNEQLLEFARNQNVVDRAPVCLDVGCGAARNLEPLAEVGYHVVGTDLARPMLDAARARLAERHDLSFELIHAPMTPLP